MSSVEAGATLNTLSIRTPEGVTFSLTLAGPTSRFLAFLADPCCISAGPDEHGIHRISQGRSVYLAAYPDLAARPTRLVAPKPASERQQEKLRRKNLDRAAGIDPSGERGVICRTQGDCPAEAIAQLED